MKKHANKLGSMEIGLRYSSRVVGEFCYPYFDCYIVDYKLDVVRIGIANALLFSLLIPIPFLKTANFICNCIFEMPLDSISDCVI